MLAQRWATFGIPGLLHGLWIAAYLSLAAPTLAFLWERWTRSIWNNGHGIFVPLLVGLLAHHALRREPTKREEPSAWGFAFLVPALVLVAADSAIQTELMAAAGILLTLPGLALLLLGARRARALAFPCFLSFFMLPIPAAFMETIHDALRRLTTAGSTELRTSCACRPSPRERCCTCPTARSRWWKSAAVSAPSTPP
jgi:hypothetical protein